MTTQQQNVDAALAANAAQVAVLLELERRARAESTRFLRSLLNNGLRRAANQYVIQFGGLDNPVDDPLLVQPIVDEFVADIEDLRGFDPTPALNPLADEARRAGVVWAERAAPEPVLDHIERSDAVTRLLDEIPGNIDAEFNRVQQLAASMQVDSWSDLAALAGGAHRTVAGVDRSAAQVVATSMSDAVDQVARAYSARVLWVAEPDACRVCLALSGHTIDPSVGEGFDETATFGRPGSAPDVWPPGAPLMHPPRHPFCRCVPQVWWGDARGPGAYDLPAALRREARRSILRGTRLPSESNRVRIDAAARLLAHGSGLPKTVEARARHAVRTGRFSNRSS